MKISPKKNKKPLLRWILYPLSWIYGYVLQIRHLLYDLKWKTSITYNYPIIVVGNLSFGGTGKTPFTSYLCTLLEQKYKVATLSRGYKRKTTGFYEVLPDMLPSEIGDEPYWLKIKHPQVTVTVGEDRTLAVAYLLQNKPFLETIILDDAFQHRKLNAKMNIMLTEHDNLFVDDALLPVGYLRDTTSASKRANIIVVTKCSSDIYNLEYQQYIRKKLCLNPQQELFFSTLIYENPIPVVDNNFSFKTFVNHHVLLITGIANTAPLINELSQKKAIVEHFNFSDHFDFSFEEIIKIITHFDKMPSPKFILCTEKDAVKIHRFQTQWKHLPIFSLPVRPKILDQEEYFLQLIEQYINSF